MKYQKLIYVVLAFLLLYAVINIITIKEHGKEISRLRHRITNLETVINRNVKISMPERRLPDFY